MGEKYYTVIFTFSDGSKNICKVLANSSIENMFQILKNDGRLASIELNDFKFLYRAENIDINSQLKVEELFKDDMFPSISALALRTSLRINFNSSSGVNLKLNTMAVFAVLLFGLYCKLILRQLVLMKIA